MGLNASLKIPSGTIRLNREFTVPDRGATTMLLDVDGDKYSDQSRLAMEMEMAMRTAMGTAARHPRRPATR